MEIYPRRQQGRDHCLKNFAVGEGNKRIVITPGFVEMGTRQAAANMELGRTIAVSCDYAIIVNAVNREAIKSGIEEGGLPAEKYFLADSLNHAHQQLAKILHQAQYKAGSTEQKSSFSYIPHKAKREANASRFSFSSYMVVLRFLM